MAHANRFVRPLSQNEISLLREVVHDHPKHRVRSRAHCILLSSKGYTRKQLAEIFEVEMATVSCWIDSFEESGIEGLSDDKRPGRPRLIGPDKEECLRRAVEENPQRPFIEFCNLVPSFRGCCRTFIRALKRLGLRWKRLRLSLRNKRDEDEFRSGKDILDGYIKLSRQGKIELYFGDESGFSLKPNVPYGWQPKNETVSFSQSADDRSRFSAVGFLNFSGKELLASVVDGSIDGATMEEALRDFARNTAKKKKRIVVVLDNAPIHKCSEVLDAISEIEEEYNIQFHFIPSYSPELSFIEILWKIAKSYWLPPKAYMNKESLIDYVLHIFSHFGTEYRITFV